MKYTLVVGCLLLLFGGCLPEENPIAPYPRGGTKTGSASMGSNYASQVFIDLSSDTPAFTRRWDTWDLEFDSSPTGWHIWLNGAKSMSIATTEFTDFSVEINASILTYYNDAPNGNDDSTAIGAWADSTNSFESMNYVYVVDRGFSAAGKPYGKLKLQLLDVHDSCYTIRYGKLDGGSEQTVTIMKDKQHSRTLFSFDTGTISSSLLPDDKSWDIVFTKYTYIFRVPEYTPYSVTGALINSAAGVVVATDTTSLFSDITSDMIQRYRFSANADAIGYDWKVFDIAGGSYSISTTNNYIIRDRNGFYWKLHFLDFYDDKGERGSPNYEFQKI